MAFQPFATELPTADVIALVMDALRNREVDVENAAKGALHLASYGAGRYFASRQAGESFSSAAFSNEDAAAALAPLTARGDGGEITEAEIAMIPCALIVPILLKLLLRIMV